MIASTEQVAAFTRLYRSSGYGMTVDEFGDYMRGASCDPVVIGACVEAYTMASQHRACAVCGVAEYWHGHRPSTACASFRPHSEAE